MMMMMMMCLCCVCVYLRRALLRFFASSLLRSLSLLYQKWIKRDISDFPDTNLSARNEKKACHPYATSRRRRRRASSARLRRRLARRCRRCDANPSHRRPLKFRLLPPPPRRRRRQRINRLRERRTTRSCERSLRLRSCPRSFPRFPERSCWRA